jgi:hypothetical protein
MALLDPMTAPLSAVLILGVLASTPVRAQVLASADEGKVRLELRGRVAPRCSLSGMPSAIDLGRIIPGGGELRREFAFQVDCNTPFVFALISPHGALRRGNNPQEAAQREIAYNARLTIWTDAGGGLSLECTSRQISDEQTGCKGSSKDNIAIRKDGILSINWVLPKTALVEGPYTSVLRLELGAGN